MFDINPKLIGLVIRGIEIRSVDDLETFIRENEIQIAALTIPKTKAPEIADRLVNAGIRASWNFAHTDLVVPEDVVVENVHLSESLMRLSYRVSSMYDPVSYTHLFPPLRLPTSSRPSQPRLVSAPPCG